MHDPYAEFGSIGATLGFKAGAVIAWLFLTGGIAIALVVPGWLTSENRLLEAGMLLIVGSMVGVPPSMFVGGLTGWLLAITIRHFGASLGRAEMLLGSLGICLAVWLTCCAVLLLVFRDLITALLVVSLPAPLYVPIGLWLGDRLVLIHRRIRAQRAAAPGAHSTSTEAP